MSLFYKYLTSRIPEIVESAKRALGQVISSGKLSKDLMQGTAKPMLQNFAEYKKLTVPLLQGMARLVELGPALFTDKMGERLLEHLTKSVESIRANPPTTPVPTPSPTQVKPGQPGQLVRPPTIPDSSKKDTDDVQIAAALINIFHLFPWGAQHIDALVSQVQQLEAASSRELASPFREPLLKFVNKCASAATEYFLDRIGQTTHSKMFTLLLKEKQAAPLRSEIMKNPDRLMKTTLGVVPNEPTITAAQAVEAQYQGLVIVSILITYNPLYFDAEDSKPLFDQLLKLWRTPDRLARFTTPDALSVPYLREPKEFVKTLLK